MKSETCGRCSHYQHKWQNYFTLLDGITTSYGPAGICTLLNSTSPAVVDTKGADSFSIPGKPEIVHHDSPCGVSIHHGCLSFKRPRLGFEERS